MERWIGELHALFDAVQEGTIVFLLYVACILIIPCQANEVIWNLVLFVRATKLRGSLGHLYMSF